MWCSNFKPQVVDWGWITAVFDGWHARFSRIIRPRLSAVEDPKTKPRKGAALLAFAAILAVTRP
jgi:hypothetical protein